MSLHFEGHAAVLHNQQPGGRGRLLLASISSSQAAEKAAATGFHLPLPHIQLGTPLPRTRAKGKGHGGLSSHALRPPAVEALAGHLQHVAAILLGGLLAGAGQVVQRVTAVRRRLPSVGRRSLPFHQSFRLPWDTLGRSSARSTREARALARSLFQQGLEYERALDVRAAVQCFEEANRLVPGSGQYLAMAAKSWSDLTFYHDVRTDRERQLVNQKAIEFAVKAIEADPQSSIGHVAICVSKGRLALFTDNRTKVRLAKEAQEAAHTAITCDPSDDVAHHLNGRWHYEMAQINMVVRSLIRFMYGTALSPGTREDALASYRRAAELRPSRLIHHVEAGRCLLEMGRKQEARQAFEAALACPVEDINAWHTRMDAERFLAQLDRRPCKQPSMVPPQQQAAAPALPTASISTAALLSGAVDEAVLAAARQRLAEQTDDPSAEASEAPRRKQHKKKSKA